MLDRALLGAVLLCCCLLEARRGRAQVPSPSLAAAEAVTPLNAPLPEGTETLITCRLTKAPTVFETRVFDSPKDADTAKGTCH